MRNERNEEREIRALSTTTRELGQAARYTLYLQARGVGCETVRRRDERGRVYKRCNDMH